MPGGANWVLFEMAGVPHQEVLTDVDLMRWTVFVLCLLLLFMMLIGLPSRYETEQVLRNETVATMVPLMTQARRETLQAGSEIR